MREIKFRIYSGVIRQKMIPWNTMKAWTMDALESDNIMQFTNRVDKNGTDIYEGDIIELIGEEDDGYMQPLMPVYGKYKVEYRGGSFLVIPLHDGMYEPYSNILKLFIDDEQQRISVIGNIYENKNLLK